MQAKEDKQNRKLSFDELEGVTGGVTGAGGDTTGVSCSVCGCKFSLPQGKTVGKCPDCGATVKKSNP